MKKHPMSGAERNKKSRDKMSQEQKEQRNNKEQQRLSQHTTSYYGSWSIIYATI